MHHSSGQLQESEAKEKPYTLVAQSVRAGLTFSSGQMPPTSRFCALCRFAGDADSLLDLACGRGGDLWKWIDANVTLHQMTPLCLVAI